MALVIADRVRETSTTTGTGTLTLAGAVSGFQTFSTAIGNTNTCYYTIVNGSEWEVGLGTVAAGTLARTTVLKSSNAGSAVNFSAGTKDVFATYPADKAVFRDANGDIVNGGGASASVVVSNRTSNTILGAADISTLINITSGTFSQTFTAAATLGSGWFCYIRNSGTGDITLDPNASELIDGLTSYIMYPGETRLVTCTGTAFTTVVLTAFFKTVTTTDSAFIWPPGYLGLGASVIGAGGGGGGGAGGSAASLRQGGSGGGGGAKANGVVTGVASGTSLVLTIGAGGTGGAGGVSAAGSAGVTGGTSSFSSYIKAFGGGAGALGSSGDRSGGSGGGTGGSGNAGGTSDTNGGLPSSAIFGGSTNKDNISGGGAGGRIGAATGFAEWGGGAGGSTDSFNSVFNGGGSIFGGGGGGSGGSVNSGNTASAGSTGGATNTYAIGGGAAGGANTGAAGTAGSNLTGAGGGGGNNAGTGGVGGAGGVGAGGGGGGGGTSTGGAGGAGGRGEIQVWGIA